MTTSSPKTTAPEFDPTRSWPIEQQRNDDLVALLPDGCASMLEVGTRDGFLAIKAADAGIPVVALDLEPVHVDHPGVETVVGDATRLCFADRTFDAVVCAEVLEHIPEQLLPAACSELLRVARRRVVIGVPYRQDLRVGATTCPGCGRRNPPYGHVNSFDEARLLALFAGARVAHRSFIGFSDRHTNALSALLRDLAGNPWGTYDQEEPCVHCGAAIEPPPPIGVARKAAVWLARGLDIAQKRWIRPHANWLHVAFEKV